MTVRELLESLQRLPRDVEVLAFEAGCDDYCEREVDEVEWQGGRVYLTLEPAGIPAPKPHQVDRTLNSQRPRPQPRTLAE